MKRTKKKRRPVIKRRRVWWASSPHFRALMRDLKQARTYLRVKEVLAKAKRGLPSRARAIVAENKRIQFRIAKKLTKGWFDKPRGRVRVRRSA